MANEIKKEAILKLQDEPYLKPISDTGVGFYNLDINTAVLTFQISKSGSPLLISEENAHSYAYFKSDNGSVSGVLDLEYKDPLNGIVTITLPTDFLQASSGSKVTGQMYITVNKWTSTPNDKSDTAVLSEFTFTVKDALINSISGETKIEYIRMFDVLKQQIQKRVNDIEEAIANGEDYVTEMKTTLESGKKELNDTVDRSKNSVQTTAEQAINDVNTTRDNTINKITNLSEETSSYVKNTADTAIQNVTGFSNEAISHVDTKLEEFDQTIANNGFLSPQILDEELGKLEWQKYKLTNDDGSVPLIRLNNDLTLLHDMKAGFYYTTGTPINGVSSTAGFTEISTTESREVKHIIFRPYNSTTQYLKRFSASQWSEWERFSTVTDTGWITFDLINGAKSNTAYKNEGDGGFDCAYRTITNGSEVTKKLRINGTNLTQNQVIAQLPANFAKNAQAFPVRVPNSSTGGYIVIRPSGRVNFYVSGDTSNWNETGYAYGECTWHD